MISVLSLAAGTLSACGDEDNLEVQDIAEEVTESITEELAEPEPDYAGDAETSNRTIEAAGKKREFIETVPPGIEEREGVPLIFVFHGYKNNANQLRKFTRFDNANAVVAYMDGIGDAWAPAPYAETTGDEDLAFFDAVREKLIADYPIDPAKVYVTGLSNGGGFAQYTACHRAHKVTGIATVSAAFYDAVFEDCSQIPVKQIDFHGTADNMMLYDGGVRHNESYQSVMDVMEEAARRNYCAPEPVTEQIDRPGEEYIWEDCDAQLRHYRIGDGGHVWPGSSGDKGSATQPQNGYASKEILDFFDISYRGAMGPTDPEN